MKKYIISVLFVLFLVLFIFTLKTQATTTTWQTFTNTTYSYQFKYPQANYYSKKDNVVIIDSSDPGNVIVKSKTGLVSATIFSVKVIPNITTTKQLKSLLNSELFPYQSIQVTTKVKTVDVTIGGIKGFKLTNDYLLNATGFIKDKQAYVFKSYNEFSLEPYKNLLSSFKFVKIIQEKTTQTKITSDVTSGVDCGSISYNDLLITMFGNETTPKLSNKTISSIKCANDSLLSCTPARLKVDGTNINPIFPDQKNFKIESHTYNITTSMKTNDCVISECVIPKQVIKNRSITEKQNLIFTLVGIGPGGLGNNDVYDPVTKLTTKNVCPNTNNPYQSK